MQTVTSDSDIEISKDRILIRKHPLYPTLKVCGEVIQLILQIAGSNN